MQIVIVHEMIPFFGSPEWRKHDIYFWEKYDILSESVVFVQTWGILQTGMDQRGDHMKMNFDYLQIQKWMFQTEQTK